MPETKDNEEGDKDLQQVPKLVESADGPQPLPWEFVHISGQTDNESGLDFDNRRLWMLNL